MGHAFVSPLRRWEIIAELCQSINAQTYVEVGCKEGQTTGHVLRECPSIAAVAIDPWMTQEASSDPMRETYKDWDFSAIEAEFNRNIGSNADRCKMLRMTSFDAMMALQIGNDDEWSLVKFMPLDVIFIDALHDYESVKEDITYWWPYVKPGGFLVLHDYNHKWPGVMRAVAECFNLFDVNLAPDSVAYVQKRAAA